jgi:hypothetical protein
MASGANAAAVGASPGGKFGELLRAYQASIPRSGCYPSNSPPRTDRFGIVTLKNRTLSPLARIFIECARDTPKSLVKGNGLRNRR